MSVVTISLLNFLKENYYSLSQKNLTYQLNNFSCCIVFSLFSLITNITGSQLKANQASLWYIIISSIF